MATTTQRVRSFDVALHMNGKTVLSNGSSFFSDNTTRT